LNDLFHFDTPCKFEVTILVIMNQLETYNELVYTKFILYKSLFSNLPYEDIQEIATYLPVFSSLCENGLKTGKSPAEITADFFREYPASRTKASKDGLFFKFIQFIERQVVLFDALEDASYAEFHPENGGGTLSELFTLATSQQKKKELARALDDFRLRLVLTAHPTQFYTSQALAIITDLTELFKVNDIPKINRLLLQLSKTPFFKKDKPTPFQEAERLTWYLSNIFYPAIPKVYCKIAAFMQSQNISTKHLQPVQIGFWPGGDRDGNPYVTHHTTLKTAVLLRESILKSYRQDVKKLRRQLTFRKVDELIESVHEKLLATISPQPETKQYANQHELQGDLEQIRQILISEHEGIYAEEVELLLLKIRLFGFHFVSMDVRQNSSAHEQAVLEILGSKGARYAASGVAGRLNILQKSIFPTNPSFSEATTEALETIRSIRQIQQHNGEEAVHRYIISNCSDLSDIAETLFLFRAAGWEAPLPVDIVPLFETIDDLSNAAGTMHRLYADSAYRQHLQRRKNRQVIMLGFSDGTKDGGYLTANWGIYKAKKELTKVSKDASIDAVFFDGRGGPAARGGGKAHLFYASMDNSIALDEIQLTIQGQTISANYGITESAVFNMEQLLHGGLAGKLLFSERNKLKKKEYELLERISAFSYAAYRQLKEDKLFLPYLEEFSPIKYLGSANITSRPASRKSGRLRYEDLRAITFVGAWYQMKQNVPGFYGMGTALKKMQEEGDLKKVQELYRHSLFFKALIDNCMMALCKTNFSLTEFMRKDAQYGRLWRRISNEYETCVSLLKQVTGMSELMENDAISKKSISIRENLVIPLSVIQQYALSKLRNNRTSKNDRAVYEKMIIRTLYGMTNAGRNSV